MDYAYEDINDWIGREWGRTPAVSHAAKTIHLAIQRQFLQHDMDPGLPFYYADSLNKPREFNFLRTMIKSTHGKAKNRGFIYSISQKTTGTLPELWAFYQTRNVPSPDDLHQWFKVDSVLDTYVDNVLNEAPIGTPSASLPLPGPDDIAKKAYWKNLPRDKRRKMIVDGYKKYRSYAGNDTGLVDHIDLILRDTGLLDDRAASGDLGAIYPQAQKYILDAVGELMNPTPQSPTSPPATDDPWSDDQWKSGLDKWLKGEAKSQHRAVSGGTWYPDLTEFMTHHKLVVDEGSGAYLRRIYRLFAYEWDNPVLYAVRKRNPEDYQKLVSRIQETSVVGLGAYRMGKDVLSCHKGGFYSMAGSWALGFPDVLKDVEQP